MRKGSDHLLNYRMKMSSTTTRGKHGAVGSSGGAGLQLSELGFRDRATSCIAEDDEAIDDEATSFAVTGTSEFFRKGNYAVIIEVVYVYMHNVQCSNT